MQRYLTLTNDQVSAVYYVPYIHASMHTHIPIYGYKYVYKHVIDMNKSVLTSSSSSSGVAGVWSVLKEVSEEVSESTDSSSNPKYVSTTCFCRTERGGAREREKRALEKRRERERDREREMERDTETHRERDRKRERKRERERLRTALKTC